MLGSWPRRSLSRIEHSNVVLRCTSEDIEISGSPGPGIHSQAEDLCKGQIGTFTTTRTRLYIDSATVVVDGLTSSDNGFSAAHVFDARYVTFSNVTSTNDGSLGSNAMEQAGYLSEIKRFGNSVR